MASAGAATCGARARLAATSSEEVQDVRDEPFVVLKHAAVAGVGVDAEVGVGESVSEVEGCAGWEHAIVFAVGDQYGMLNEV